jgi:hypothetical protein
MSDPIARFRIASQLTDMRPGRPGSSIVGNDAPGRNLNLPAAREGLDA